MTRLRLQACVLLAISGGLVACAETSPSAPPAEEVLLVVNSTEASLSVIPVNAPSSAFKIPFGGTTPTPVGVSARREIAIVPLGLDNALAVINLRTRVVDLVPLAANSGATGSVIIDDSIAYVANPNLNTITRVNYLTKDTASVAVGQYPQGVVFTRGKVFVLNGNLVNFAPVGPSWITVIDPVTNAKASGIDSIPLPGPGNAGFAAVDGVGLLWVMNVGAFDNSPSAQGRLSIVDPVSRVEQANFGGFGNNPGNVATDGGNRLFISSYNEGVMEFDTQSRTVVRGAGDGVMIPLNAGVEVDSQGRVYALESGPCAGGTPGKVHILRPDLSESSSVDAGECAIGAAVTNIPPE